MNSKKLDTNSCDSRDSDGEEAKERVCAIRAIITGPFEMDRLQPTDWSSRVQSLSSHFTGKF